jgi:uncharacterized protein
MHKSVSIHNAYVKGDLATLRALLGNPPDFPNTRGPRGVGEIILEYAIYWSPLPFIRALLELGADPNYADSPGFPSLIAALSTGRADKIEILQLLLTFGADVRQRGVNGYTPLHYAAAKDDPMAIELLLAHGADPTAKTYVDDDTTPLEEAERGRHPRAVEILRKLTKS